MQEHQIWTHNVAELRFAIFTYHGGLFCLYDLGIQTKVNFPSINSKWPQIIEKSVKFWFSMAFGLWFGLHDLHWPFSILLRSLISKKCSDMQQSYIRALFHQKQFLNEISHFGSLCTGKEMFSLSMSHSSDPLYLCNSIPNDIILPCLLEGIKSLCMFTSQYTFIGFTLLVFTYSATL